MTLIYRITHFQNLPFILQYGLHCPNSPITDPGFIPIGFPTLINFRAEKVVPIAPGGTLADYIPFYFCTQSPMLYVIAKGNDPEVIQTPQEEIIYLISSLEQLVAHQCQFVLTDRHAKVDLANFYNQPQDIDKLNWDIIQSPQWGRTYGTDRKEIKQSECLVYQHMPANALLGIAVMNDKMQQEVTNIIFNANATIRSGVRPNFYF